MKRYFLIPLLALISISSTFSQNSDTDKDREKYEAKVEEEKQKYISDFMATLKVDDFQREIIRQSIDSYFDEIAEINKLGLKSYQRKEAIERLDNRHFSDVRAMVSEEVMTKIMNAVKGKWDRKKAIKTRKRKQRKNKN